MKKIFFISYFFFFIFSYAVAQDVYQSQKMVETDLNGTARYIGMGGALEALGADLTTMSTNPAGMALFHSSQVSISGGLNFQPGQKNSCSYAGQTIDFHGANTRGSLDHAGFVWSSGTDQERFFNFGFQYRKSQNFDQLLSAAASLDNASQSKLSSVKYNYMKTVSASDADILTNGVDANYQALMGYNASKDTYDYLTATDYRFGQYQKGYIGEYDFNLSYNHMDRWYFGLTLGLHDVHYTSNSLYDETNELSAYTESFEMVTLKGLGVDVKLGAIVRPFDDNNFRVGAYLSTPVWYSLKYDAQSDISINQDGNSGSSSQDCYYDFKLNTPWKFGVSVGDVFGKWLAVGATYEYQKLSSNSNRVQTNNSGSSYADNVQNDWAHQCLQGLHTIKVGAEIHPMDKLYLRMGYNYLSPMYRKSAYRDGATLVSPGSSYACSTDYTNWYQTHRFTLGAGYMLTKNVQCDLAYQYQTRKGSFSPFLSYTDDANSDYDNIPQTCDINYNRHQITMTLTYKF